MLQYNDIRQLTQMLETVTTDARRVRQTYRRKSKMNDAMRQRMLSAAVDNIAEVMVPVRSEMGKLIYRTTDPTVEEKFRAASKSAQLERHKLLKMLGARARH